MRHDLSTHGQTQESYRKENKMLEGKLTYIGALGAGLLATYYLFDGQLAKAVEMYTLAIGLAGLRRKLGNVAI
jgi:hypothetical protein